MESKYYFYSVECTTLSEKGWTGYMCITSETVITSLVTVFWINDLTEEIVVGGDYFQTYTMQKHMYTMRMIDKATYMKALNIWACSTQ